MCFKLAVTRSVFPENKNQEQINVEPHKNAKKFHWDGINFPTRINDFKKFKRKNSKIFFYSFFCIKIRKSHKCSSLERLTDKKLF